MIRFDKTKEVVEKNKVETVIESLEDAFARMLIGMRERMRNGEYDLIIGEDASGRIPTLIVKKVVDAVYGNKFPHPKTIFFAGKGHASDVQDFLIKNGIHSDKRVLVVTDTIVSGSSIYPIMEALKRCGMSFDIATLGLSENFYEWEESFGLGKIFFGFKDHIPDVYMRPKMSGVTKTTGDLHAKSYVKMTENQEWQKMVNYTREQVDELSDDLIKKLLPGM